MEEEKISKDISESSFKVSSESEFEGDKEKYNIAFVSDFFYPRLGGVEMHIYQLAQWLQDRGHKVIIITNTHGDRQGIRYLSNGLKVYYTPICGMFDQASMPTLFLRLPLFRYIFIRERIQIVHGHQATAMLQYEVSVIAKTLGLKTVFTDHSLFNFSDPENILLNKLIKTMLSELDAAIWVSHVNKENLFLRLSIPPSKIYVISNSINACNFKPDPSLRPKDTINIIILSRLTYRKGIDLIVNVIPRIWEKYPKVRFIVGGQGDKRQVLMEMTGRYCLMCR
jgi:phosphatidylinositol N-acetylglucosaminyltransferase subunit A